MTEAFWRKCDSIEMQWNGVRELLAESLSNLGICASSGVSFNLCAKGNAYRGAATPPIPSPNFSLVLRFVDQMVRERFNQPTQKRSSCVGFGGAT
jgi:hypothetical protein